MFLSLDVPDEHLNILNRLDEVERKCLIKNCVHAIIILGQERTPIKKSDLNKLVFSTVGLRSIPQAVIQAANYELNKIFGMRLYEIDDKTKLILINSKTEFSKYHYYNTQMCEELTVLFFILMDIFAAPEEKKSEEDLLEDLKGLDCDIEILKGYLETFVKKLYLVTSREQEHRMYSWGPRTIAELDPDNFFNSFLELVGDSEDKDWPDLKKRIETLKNMENR